MEFATVVTEQKPGKFIALCDGRSFSNEVNEANALLIAAAPETAAERDRLREINAELLEQLIITAGHFERCIISSGSDPDFAAIAVEKARAAIAKATGETS